eukprot:Gregarina_sp_Poly_1__3625@NODE_2068_length_2740_cov_92_736626_g919_i1_p1_GENE_NODE_2068_length_2740_cov_92_736626_g919_i1NODE_2068_length_2740_cov_92_736626_g919_i1_p1_ORF_typecomplete_len677_score91_19_NODE_2068_length_2740_cov_92_736626_g919_i16052635
MLLVEEVRGRKDALIDVLQNGGEITDITRSIPRIAICALLSYILSVDKQTILGSIEGWDLDELREIDYYIRSNWTKGWTLVARLIFESDYVSYLLCETQFISVLDATGSPPQYVKLNDGDVFAESTAVFFRISFNRDVPGANLFAKIWKVLFTVCDINTSRIVASRLLKRYTHHEIRSSILDAELSPLIVARRITHWLQKSSDSFRMESEIRARWMFILYWLCIFPSHFEASVKFFEPFRLSLSSNRKLEETPMEEIPQDEWRRFCPKWHGNKQPELWGIFFDTFFSFHWSADFLTLIMDPRNTISESLLMPIPMLFICNEIRQKRNLAAREHLLVYLAQIWARCIWHFDFVETALSIGISVLFHTDFLCVRSSGWAQLAAQVEKGILLRNSGYSPTSRLLACAVSETFMKFRMHDLKPQPEPTALLQDYWIHVVRSLRSHLYSKQHPQVPSNLQVPSNQPYSIDKISLLTVLTLAAIGVVPIDWNVIEITVPINRRHTCWHHLLEATFAFAEDVADACSGKHLESRQLTSQANCAADDKQLDASGVTDKFPISLGDISTADGDIMEMSSEEEDEKIFNSICNQKRFTSNSDSKFFAEIRQVHDQVESPFYPSESLSHSVARLKTIVLPAEINPDGASLELTGALEQVGKRITLQKFERQWIAQAAIESEIPKFLE